ncbi:MAG: hypothetical protein HY332_11575 [Chloroflexi bacterium]|nr:hypothetical protein [Chloroflexota bacterium]
MLGALGRLADEPGMAVAWLTGEEERRCFGDLTIQVTEAFIADHEQSEAAFGWFRGTWHDVQRHRDGLTLDVQGLSPLMTTLGKLLPASSREQGDRFWLRAGRVWQRLHLWGTAHGLAMQPLDQAPIRAEREAQLGFEPRIRPALAEVVGERGWRAALAFRLGYPTRAAALSPRRGVQEVLT